MPQNSLFTWVLYWYYVLVAVIVFCHPDKIILLKQCAFRDPLQDLWTRNCVEILLVPESFWSRSGKIMTSCRVPSPILWYVKEHRVQHIWLATIDWKVTFLRFYMARPSRLRNHEIWGKWEWGGNGLAWAETKLYMGQNSNHYASLWRSIWDLEPSHLWKLDICSQ